MHLLSIYHNGQRYYSAPVESLPPVGFDNVIDTPTLRVDCAVFPDGDTFYSMFEKMTDDQFLQYKNDPSGFTAKKVY